MFFAEAFSFFLAFLDQFSAGAFHGAVEGDHFLKIFDGFFVEVGVFSGHCSSEEVFGVVFVVLEDLVGEVYAEWPFLPFVVAEGEVGVGWEYDFFEHVGYVGFEGVHVGVVFEDVFEGHHCFRELFGGREVVLLADQFASELGGLECHVEVANELFLWVGFFFRGC